MSELNGVALVRALGAESAVRIAENDQVTPDFHFSWGGERGELEVTKADPKPARFQLSEEQAFFGAEIAKLGLPWGFILHVVHPWPREVSLRILRAASQLKLGEQAEEAGKWRLCAECSNVHVQSPSAEAPPRWWPEKSAPLFALRQAVDGCGGVVQPHVRVQFTIPVTTYINPIANKVEHFQGSDTAPFLIVLDVSALPHAFETLYDELPEWFVAWKRVSGVLVFFGPAMIGPAIGWMWGLIPNRRAPNHTLPRAMLDSVPAHPHLKHLSFPVRTAEGPVVMGCQFTLGTPSGTRAEEERK